MINIMINMIFILVLPSNFGRVGKTLALSASVEWLMANCCLEKDKTDGSSVSHISWYISLEY
jgi:hypothetical protein